MNLELFGLKYETSFNNKTYIIEANDFYSDTDETKWIINCDGGVLTKDYELVKSMLIKSDKFAFDTKDEAIQALKIYLTIQDKINESIKVYKAKLELFESQLELLYDSEDPLLDGKAFLDLDIIVQQLQKECPFYITKSCSNRLGVQVTIAEIRWIYLLQDAITKIEKNYSCQLVNYYSKEWTHFNYNKPLYYYYWAGGNSYTRQFAFVKNDSI